MIIFTPINLPIVKPDSWDIFWNIWNKHSRILVKEKINTKTTPALVGTKNVWIGLDIFKKFDIPLVYSAPYFDIKDSLPNLFESLNNLCTNLHTIRLVQSITDFVAHTDDDLDKWSLRAFFHGENVSEQWYFTKPYDRNGQRYYIEMPNDTNWFMYNDKYCWHGTDFDSTRKKIILQVFCFGSPNVDYLTSSIEKYKLYTIKFL